MSTQRTIRATLAAALLAVTIPLTWTAVGITVQLSGPHPDPLCGRACLPAGVTENPAITLIGVH